MLMADLESDDPTVQKFVTNYENEYGELRSIQAQMGYVAADLTVMGMQNAGTDLTVDTLIAGLEQITDYTDIFGGPGLSF
jgi:branched-chain amino acid transport system substrate-binding protein